MSGVAFRTHRSTAACSRSRPSSSEEEDAVEPQSTRAGNCNIRVRTKGGMRQSISNSYLALLCAACQACQTFSMKHCQNKSEETTLLKGVSAATLLKNAVSTLLGFRGSNMHRMCSDLSRPIIIRGNGEILSRSFYVLFTCISSSSLKT